MTGHFSMSGRTWQYFAHTFFKESSPARWVLREDAA